MTQDDLLNFLMDEGVDDWNLWRIADRSILDLSNRDIVDAFAYRGRILFNNPLP